jgi:hypothetical protein
MADLGDLNSAINAIDSSLQKASYNADSVRQAITDLSKIKVSVTDPEDLKNLEKKIQVLKDIQKQAKDTYETERKGLEMVTGQNKRVLELLDKTILKHTALRRGVLNVVGAYQSLKDKGDLGAAISQVSQLFGRFGILGEVIGIAVSAATKFQDRIQAVNKTIIDTTASLGRFSDGMAMSQQQTLALSTGMAKYAQFVGIGTEELYKHTQGLGALGFSLEEIGIDKTTGRITSLTEAIRGQTGEWGALSTSVGVSRATGLDIQSVMQTMGVQVKTLGDTVEEVAESFGMLSMAADKSGLSTQTLLPLVRSMQEQFKFLGFDSTAAAEALGRAGQVAEAAGITAGQATQVMARAVGGIAGMDFGQMAFFGQQLGMGGGLQAGFRFRQQAGGEGGANLAVEIGRTIGNIMGGGGSLITEEAAATNEHLASIRLAQEKFASQSLGLSQNEARVFINMAAELENLRATGEGQTDRAKELEKTMKGMEMGEAEYRQKTLTLSQKIAQFLELISTLVGRLLLTFIRAFMGGAAAEAEGGVTGLFKKAMEGISKGEGLDVTFGPEGGFQKAFEKSFADIEPAIKRWGERMGKTFNMIFGSWSGTIIAALTGVGVIAMLRRSFLGMLTKATMVDVAGGGVRQIATFAERFSVGQRAAQATMRASPTVRGMTALTNAMGNATQSMGRFGGGLRMAGRGFAGLAKGGFAASRALLGPVGLVAAAYATGHAIGTFIANFEIGGKSISKHIGDFVADLAWGTKAVKKYASTQNSAAEEALEAAKKLELITGVTTQEARSRLEQKGVAGVLKESGRAQGEIEIQQALAELRRVAIAQGEAAKESQRLMEEEQDDFIVNQSIVEKYRQAMEAANATLRTLNNKIAEYEAALGAIAKPVGDAWDISQGGLFYASPGDMIVSSESMGKAGSKGAPGTAPRGGGAEAIERDIILNVKFMHDLIGQIAEQQIMISVEKDIVASGKAGRSAMRHGGPSQGYGGG